MSDGLKVDGRHDVDALLELSYDDIEDQINQPSTKFDIQQQAHRVQSPTKAIPKLEAAETGFKGWNQKYNPLPVKVRLPNNSKIRNAGLLLNSEKVSKCLISKTSPTNLFNDFWSQDMPGSVDNPRMLPRISQRPTSRINSSTQSTDDTPYLPSIKRSPTNTSAQPNGILGILSQLSAPENPGGLDVCRSLEEHLRSRRPEERSWALAQLKRIQLLSVQIDSRKEIRQQQTPQQREQQQRQQPNLFSEQQSPDRQIRRSVDKQPKRSQDDDNSDLPSARMFPPVLKLATKIEGMEDLRKSRQQMENSHLQDKDNTTHSNSKQSSIFRVPASRTIERQKQREFKDYWLFNMPQSLHTIPLQKLSANSRIQASFNESSSHKGEQNTQEESVQPEIDIEASKASRPARLITWTKKNSTPQASQVPVAGGSTSGPSSVEVPRNYGPRVRIVLKNQPEHLSISSNYPPSIRSPAVATPVQLQPSTQKLRPVNKSPPGIGDEASKRRFNVGQGILKAGWMGHKPQLKTVEMRPMTPEKKLTRKDLFKLLSQNIKLNKAG